MENRADFREVDPAHIVALVPRQGRVIEAVYTCGAADSELYLEFITGAQLVIRPRVIEVDGQMVGGFLTLWKNGVNHQERP